MYESSFLVTHCTGDLARRLLHRSRIAPLPDVAPQTAPDLRYSVIAGGRGARTPQLPPEEGVDPRKVLPARRLARRLRGALGGKRRCE